MYYSDMHATIVSSRRAAKEEPTAADLIFFRRRDGCSLIRCEVSAGRGSDLRALMDEPTSWYQAEAFNVPFTSPLPACSKSVLQFSRTVLGLGNDRYIPSSQQAQSGIAAIALRALFTPLPSPSSHRYISVAQRTIWGRFSLQVGGGV